MITFGSPDHPMSQAQIEAVMQLPAFAARQKHLERACQCGLDAEARRYFIACYHANHRHAKRQWSDHQAAMTQQIARSKLRMLGIGTLATRRGPMTEDRREAVRQWLKRRRDQV